MSSEKLTSIESDVTSIRKRLQRSNVLSLVVGSLVLLLMMGYFIYGYSEINSVLKPKIIVDLSQTLVDDNIPEVKRTIHSEVERNAPIWAASLSQQALASVPQMREQLVAYTTEQTDQLVSRSIELSEQDFEEFITKNRSSIVSAMDELENDEDVSTELLGVIENGFNEILQADLEQDAEEILAYSVTMEDKMTRLVANKNLDKAEKLERQALMILRRLQMSELKE